MLSLCWVLLNYTLGLKVPWQNIDSNDHKWIESNWILLNQIESNWIQLNPIESNWILLNPIESYWIKLNPIESNWIQLNPIESNWITLNPTESNWIKSNCWYSTRDLGLKSFFQSCFNSKSGKFNKNLENLKFFDKI